eukprot:scaffold43384_cov63-Phaeocystis_antarctica.AAC.2
MVSPPPSGVLRNARNVYARGAPSKASAWKPYDCPGKWCIRAVSRRINGSVSSCCRPSIAEDELRREQGRRDADELGARLRIDEARQVYQAWAPCQPHGRICVDLARARRVAAVVKAALRCLSSLVSQQAWCQPTRRVQQRGTLAPALACAAAAALRGAGLNDLLRRLRHHELGARIKADR